MGFNDVGFTPLLLTAQLGHTLIDRGADVHAKDESDWTPLHWAGTDDHNAICQMLLEHGADLGVLSLADHTPLHMAARFGAA